MQAFAKIGPHSPLMDGYKKEWAGKAGILETDAFMFGIYWKPEEIIESVPLSLDNAHKFFNDETEALSQIAHHTKTGGTVIIRGGHFIFSRGVPAFKLANHTVGPFTLEWRFHPSEEKLIRNLKVVSSYGHPHVQNSTLCYGDSSQGALAAIADGRIFDFFDLVETVLRNYDQNNAYNPIEYYGAD